MCARDSSALHVREVGADCWRVWRDLRLEALADTPMGYGERFADAVLCGEQQWRERLARPGAYLFAVYVQPSARGGGVLRALVEELQSWAPGEPLALHVHEDNVRAQAAYERLRFAVTGAGLPYVLEPAKTLREMVRPV